MRKPARAKIGIPSSRALGNDVLSAINVAGGVNAVNYNFGELPPTISKRRLLASAQVD